MNRIYLITCFTLAAFACAPQPAKAGWPCCYPAVSYTYPTVYYPPYYAYYPPDYGYYPRPVSRPWAPPPPRAYPPVPATTLNVVAPPGATVQVENERVPLVDGQFTFDVPGLEAGKRYAYQFRAEVMRGGVLRLEQRTVAFRTGENVVVDFRNPAPGTGGGD